MKQIEEDEVRERRIRDEAIVDAYGPEEQALGWYYYLEEQIAFPFTARCIEARRISPLKKGEKVSVIEMAPEDDCMHEMFVVIEWKERNFGVPLAQLDPVDVDDDTQEAIKDWRYWVKRGYQLG
jgi:Calcium binding